MTSSRTSISSPSGRSKEKPLPLPKLSDLGVAALLVLCAVLPYVNSLNNDFLLTYDDGTQILRNPYVHSFHYLRQIFTSNVWSYVGGHSISNYYRPLMTFGYLVCYKIFGPHAFGFHLTSLAFHAGVVCLVYFVLKHITSSRLLSGMAAVFFALHPVHTESIDWISGITDIQVTFFCLLAFWFLLRSGELKGKRFEFAQAGMAVSYILALLSKEQALILPVLAALYEHFYRRENKGTRWQQKLARYRPLWLLAIAYFLVRVRFLGGFAPSLERPSFGFIDTFLAGIALLGQYMWKLIWPADLNAFHVFPSHVYTLLPWIIVGLVFLGLSIALFIWLWKHDRSVSFALVWLLVTLAPVLNARWMGVNVFAERYLYLPSVGFCWLAMAGWYKLWRLAFNTKKALWHNLAPLATAIIVALCILRITTRNRDWRNDIVLYRSTLADNPQSYRVREALGLAYWTEGDVDLAQQEWRRVLRLAPENASTWNYLGGALAEEGHFDKARHYLLRAVQLQPDYAEAHLSLGSVYAEQRMIRQAELQFRVAVALSPLYFPARNILGKLYYDSGQYQKAVEQFKASVRIEPNVAAFDRLGDIWAIRKDFGKAEHAFKAALALNPADSQAHFSLGKVYAETGRYRDAIQEYVAGLKIRPEDRQAREALETLRRKSLGKEAPQP